MPEGGYITVEDLDNFRRDIEGEMEVLAGYLQQLRRKEILMSWSWAQVLDQATFQSKSEQIYGVGSVQVRIPRLDIEEPNKMWARPLRPQGRFVVPPKESWVLVTFLGGSPEHCRYCFAEFLDGPAVFGTEETNAEEIGFTPPDPSPLGNGRLPPTAVGQYLREARQFPGRRKILESDEDFIFYKDSVSSRLQLSVADGWDVHLTAGAGGKIFIGGFNPLSGTTPGVPSASTDVEIEPGTAGSVTIKSPSGTSKIQFDSATGEIVLQQGPTTKVEIKPTEINIETASPLKLKGSTVDIGNAPLGGVVTTLTDPLVDNITGAAHIGSLTVSAGS